jgi:toxin ParE1/3/4
MSRRVVTRARALRDLEERSEFIRQRNPRAALRFLVEAEATFRRLAAMPGTGARFEPDHPVLADLRYAPITRHKSDLVFYRPLDDGIEIVRVLHAARDISGVLADEFGIGGEPDDEPGGLRPP